MKNGMPEVPYQGYKDKLKEILNAELGDKVFTQKKEQTTEFHEQIHNVNITKHLPYSKQDVAWMKSEIRRLAKKGWTVEIQYVKRVKGKYQQISKPKGRISKDVKIVLVRTK